MGIHPLAGKPAPANELIDVANLVELYYSQKPDPDDPRQAVVFGTSGHRGTSLDGSFTESHVLAISQAICEQRAERSIDGPLFIGRDTHALSGPAQQSALEVFAANGLQVVIQSGDGATPTPVVSHAILAYNRANSGGLADGVVITPSHNPPGDGGFKYNPPHGGPAGSDITGRIQKRANKILAGGLHEVKRVTLEAGRRSGAIVQRDFVVDYVADLNRAVDMRAIADSDLKLGADPLGGSTLAYWEPIAERYKVSIELLNRELDPAFGFMTLDGDGKIRMDCSSPYAMAGLIANRHNYDLAFGNDPDGDRHGIVTRSAGLLSPTQYLAAAARYLFEWRPDWKAGLELGKTLVTSSLLDRLAAEAGRGLYEVPVGFKWFVNGLVGGRLAFCGEESAGASFVRLDGSVWTTDKDGILLDLLAAEITAKVGRDPGEIYQEIAARLGTPAYRRIDAPASQRQKEVLSNLTPEAVAASELAGEPIVQKLTHAPGNGAPIGGLKVVAENGWFAARPSGTEDKYKIYAESFAGTEQLEKILAQAQDMVADVFKAAGL